MMADKRFLDNNMLVLAVDIALMKDNFAQAKRYLWVCACVCVCVCVCVRLCVT